MKNVKTLRKKNAEFLVQLLIDQRFYVVRLENYDEKVLREKANGIRTKRDAEMAKLNKKLEDENRKGQPPKQEEMEGYLGFDKSLKEVEKVINEFEALKEGQTKGKKSIKDVRKILKVMDGLSSVEKDELNNL